MIAYIKGIVAAITQDALVLEHNGMAYEIFMPMSALDSVGSIGSEIAVHTYLNVREDALQLYGFLTKADLDIFKLLITVNGIGPKGAIGILSTITSDKLRFAVLAEDAKTIAKAPGIGSKTASKLILELKDKLSIMPDLSGFSAEVSETSGMEPNRQLKSDALEALVALGYTPTEAMQAIAKIKITEDMGAETLLKLALKTMMR